MAIKSCKLSKCFRGSMTPDPLESFLLLKLPEKTTLEKVTKFDAPCLKKFLNTLLTWSIYKRLLYARFRVLTSLYFVNILPNSKLHTPPPKLCGPATDWRILMKLEFFCIGQLRACWYQIFLVQCPLISGAMSYKADSVARSWAPDFGVYCIIWKLFLINRPMKGSWQAETFGINILSFKALRCQTTPH